MAIYRVVSGALSGKVVCLHGDTFDGELLSSKELKELEARGVIEEVGETSTGKLTPVLTHKSKSTAVESKWNIDPKTLAGVSLADLNAMITDRDKEGKVQPFRTVDEAIAFLTQDFEG